MDQQLLKDVRSTANKFWDLFPDFMNRNFSLVNIYPNYSYEDEEDGDSDVLDINEEDYNRSISHRLTEEFEEFKSLKHSLSELNYKGVEWFTCVYGTCELISNDDMIEQIVDKLIDESLTIKKNDILTKDKFSTIYFLIEFATAKTHLFINIYSVEDLGLDLPTPYLVLFEYYIGTKTDFE